MCGISGIINLHGIDPLSVARMTDIIRHRGPDDEGYFFADEGNQIFIGGGSDTPPEVWSYASPYQPKWKIHNFHEENIIVGLGHRRLSILDLSPSGHQPMCFANARYWIVMNGEIYNYLELRKELISLGYSFLSNSDTEIILAAWQEWGIKCQEHFNGMWSFVIYDSINKTIFLSRDRFGIKPLYYFFSSDGSFCFASEIKQFTVLKGWEAKMNPQRVYDYLLYAYTDHTEETLFSGVYQIPGGHCFMSEIKQLAANKTGKLTLHKWYLPESRPFPGTFAEASREFESLFISAVDLHVRADVPVGSALSGGIDSSAIVCQVNNILRKQGVESLQKTFSSCSSDERYSEKKWMDVVVEHTKVDAYYIYPGWEEIFRLTPELIWYHDEPYQSQSALLGYNVFKLAKSKGVIVLLNGQGADEYLGGYGQFTNARIIKMFRQLDWMNLIREISDSGAITKYSYPFVLRTILSSMIPGPIKDFLLDNLSVKRVINNTIDIKKLGAEDRIPNKVIPFDFNTVQNISKHVTFHSTLPKYLKWEDRNSMANSVEARVPFLDYRLFEFSLGLPDNYLDFKGETKRVLRSGLKNILPEKIKNRPDKKGFLTPEERWVKEDNPKLFRDKIEDAIQITDRIIKPEALKYYDKLSAGTIPFDYTYWHLILFSEWIKRFNVKLT